MHRIFAVYGYWLSRRLIGCSSYYRAHGSTLLTFCWQVSARRWVGINDILDAGAEDVVAPGEAVFVGDAALQGRGIRIIRNAELGVSSGELAAVVENEAWVS